MTLTFRLFGMHLRQPEDRIGTVMEERKMSQA
jgi:hypothetical protein